MKITEEQKQVLNRQNILLKQYMEKHFSSAKIKQLVEEFSFSELRKLMGEIDIEYFSLCYFEKYFERKFGQFHRELFAELKYMLNNNGLIEAFGLPREHGKSTINSFLFPLYATLYNKSQFTLIISATEMIALPFLDMIKDELETNQLLIEDFGIVKGNRWNNNEIWIKGKNGIDACIMIRGIDGSLRGVHFKNFRPTLVLIDDLLKDDTAKSETKREQIKASFTDVILPIGTRDTNILMVGTILNDEDLMADLLKGKVAGVRSIRKSSIINWSESEHWAEWETKYNDLQDEDRIQTALSFFNANKEEMLEGTEILWPEYLEYYYLLCKMQAMGVKSFQKEFQNDPRSTDDYIFQDIQYWDRLPDFDEMELVMYVDPAIKAGKRNDFSAITILGLHRKLKQKYVVDGSIYKLLPDDLFQVAIEKLQQYPVEKIGFETTAAQSYIKQKFEEELWKNKIFTPVDEVISRGQKHERIISLEPEVKKGHILFNPANIRYNNQVKDYNKGAKHDDAPDSLFGAVQLVQGVKSIRFFDRSLLF